ncbi:hypothetical protein [Comamonas terrigena]|uniref:hypothetical protein n=1 Tax=Comamonas terrigena TaxID=32013 RepID=UPI003132DC53
MSVLYIDRLKAVMYLVDDNMARIHLDVPPDMHVYAHEHGAQYDSVFRVWYVEDEVPNELINLLPKKNKPRVDTRNIKPLCPVCEADMFLKVNKKTNKEFWSCSRYSRSYYGCLGSLDYDEGLELIDKRIAEIEEKFNDSAKNKINFIEHQAIIKEIALYAKEFFEDEDKAAIWLQTNQVCLSGRIPSVLMTKYEGCIQVKGILERLIKLKMD